MFEKYVKLVAEHRKDMPDCFCPIDIDNGSIVIGLSLIGFCDGEVVGEYNEDTEKLTLYKQSEENKEK